MIKRDRLTGTKLYEREKFLSEYKGEDRVVTSKELSEEVLEDSTLYKSKTGMPSMDRILDGVEAGELVVVTGPPGQGKTTLLMSITQNMARVEDSTLWFTLEVTPRQFLQKIKSASGEMPAFYVPRNPIDFVDQAYLDKWQKEHRRQYEMIDWIEDRIIEARVKYETEGKRLRAVFIDHIHQLFSSTQFNTNLSLEIGDLVAKIKDMALAYDLTIFLVAHCKDVPPDTSREIRMSDIRDSGMIIRLADIVMGCWRIPNDDDGTKRRQSPIGEEDTKAKISIFKNRRTGKLGFFTAWHENHYLKEASDYGF